VDATAIVSITCGEVTEGFRQVIVGVIDVMPLRRDRARNKMVEIAGQDAL
jgi:hypothetical protein